MRLLEFLTASNKGVSSMIFALALGIMQKVGATNDEIANTRRSFLSGKISIDHLMAVTQALNHHENILTVVTGAVNGVLAKVKATGLEAHLSAFAAEKLTQADVDAAMKKFIIIDPVTGDKTSNELDTTDIVDTSGNELSGSNDTDGISSDNAGGDQGDSVGGDSPGVVPESFTQLKFLRSLTEAADEVPSFRAIQQFVYSTVISLIKASPDTINDIRFLIKGTDQFWVSEFDELDSAITKAVKADEDIVWVVDALADTIEAVFHSISDYYEDPMNHPPGYKVQKVTMNSNDPYKVFNALLKTFPVLAEVNRKQEKERAEMQKLAKLARQARQAEKQKVFSEEEIVQLANIFKDSWDKSFGPKILSKLKQDHKKFGFDLPINNKSDLIKQLIGKSSVSSTKGITEILYWVGEGEGEGEGEGDVKQPADFSIMIKNPKVQKRLIELIPELKRIVNGA